MNKLILITVDSLRPDFLGAYGASERAPATDALAEGGALIQHAFATGPDTTHSFPGILGSNYPTTGGTIQTFGARTSVGECFARAGFQTAAFHSNPLLSRGRGYARGFDTFWDSLPGAQGQSSGTSGNRRNVIGFVARRFPRIFGLGRWFYRTRKRRSIPVEQPHEPAEVITEKAIRWLGGAGERFLLWLHYMDPHWPYATRLPELSETDRVEAMRLCEKALKHPARLDDAELARLRKLYALEVRHLDRSLGELFRFLQDNGLWDETAVFLTSDHGQAFGEHGTCFHGDVLYEELIRVPLIVKAPCSGTVGRRALVSLIDLAPTICEAGGVEPSPSFEGRSMLAGPERDVVFAETAYRTFVSDSPRVVAARTVRWKLIRNEERNKTELYDLEADPEEKRDLSRERPEQLAHMRRLLESHMRRRRPHEQRPADEPKPAESTDRETLQARLRALGYMDEADRQEKD